MIEYKPNDTDTYLDETTEEMMKALLPMFEEVLNPPSFPKKEFQYFSYPIFISLLVKKGDIEFLVTAGSTHIQDSRDYRMRIAHLSEGVIARTRTWDKRVTNKTSTPRFKRYQEKVRKLHEQHNIMVLEGLLLSKIVIHYKESADEYWITNDLLSLYPTDKVQVGLEKHSKRIVRAVIEAFENDFFHGHYEGESPIHLFTQGELEDVYYEDE